MFYLSYDISSHNQPIDIIFKYQSSTFMNIIMFSVCLWSNVISDSGFLKSFSSKTAKVWVKCFVS